MIRHLAKTSGELSTHDKKTRLIATDPWLPPRTNNVCRSGLAGVEDNRAIERRIGFPVTTTEIDRGSRRMASVKPQHVVFAIRHKNEVARPGTAFCSNNKIGTPARRAATAIGTLAYPPIATTSETRESVMIRSAARTPVHSRAANRTGFLRRADELSAGRAACSYPNWATI